MKFLCEFLRPAVALPRVPERSEALNPVSHFVRGQRIMHQAQHLDDLPNRPLTHTTIGNPGMWNAAGMMAEKIRVMRDEHAALAAGKFQMYEIIRRT